MVPLNNLCLCPTIVFSTSSQVMLVELVSVTNGRAVVEKVGESISIPSLPSYNFL